MIITKFIDKELHRAARKALDFWYKKMRDECTLLDFIENCSWRKSGSVYVVTYRGTEEDESDI